jgi:hypothetical protein
MFSCLMFREDSITKLSSLSFSFVDADIPEENKNREESYRERYKRFLTQGNRQCCTVETAPSPQSVLACEVPHCATRHGAPRS